MRMTARTSWYRGNLHMHSLWSDGDEFPEAIAAHFKAAGYHFIAFTEHDRFQAGDPPPVNDRCGGALSGLGRAAAAAARLKPLSEYRGSVEEPGRFLILNGEEVSVACQAGPHWINVINAPRAIGPLRAEGGAAEAALGVIQQAGRGSLVSFNHPNYVWNAAAEDLADAGALEFFEIHTALNSTWCYGDALRAGAERMWDIILALRLGKPGGRPIYGIATDDCHFYGTDDAGACRAWVMVRAAELAPDALLQALRAGDFYSSTGVVLEELDADARGVRLRIREEPGVSYVTRFIGTRRGVELNAQPVLGEDGAPLRTTARYSDQVGAVLKESRGCQAEYAFAGDEMVVRAVVTSDCPHPRPTVPGDVMKAWTQPCLPPLSAR
jgi:hypothetical protein